MLRPLHQSRLLLLRILTLTTPPTTINITAPGSDLQARLGQQASSSARLRSLISEAQDDP